MTGHIGRIGGRQVVAVLALGGGLLLGPVLSAQAAEDNATAPGDAGFVPTALEAAHDLVAPVLNADDGGPGGKGKAHGKGSGKGHGNGEHGGKGQETSRGKGQGKGKGKGHG